VFHRHERGRRRGERRRHHGAQGGWQFCYDIPHQPHGRGAVAIRPEKETDLNHRSHAVQAESELGHNAEVPTATSNGPEEIGVHRLAGLDNAPVRKDNLGGNQIVDRQAMQPTQPAHATAQCQPADAGVAHAASGRCEAMRLGGGIQIPKKGATLDPSDPGFWIDLHRIQPPKIDNESTITSRQPGEAVTTATHGNLKAPLLGEADGRGNVA